MSTDTPGVLHFRVKPEIKREDGTTVRLRGGMMAVARYEPGSPLGALRAVALEADDCAELAEVPLPGETVLLVRWTRPPVPSPAWEVVRPGQYLASSGGRPHLHVTDEDGLRERCDLLPGGRGRANP